MTEPRGAQVAETVRLITELLRQAAMFLHPFASVPELAELVLHHLSRRAATARAEGRHGDAERDDRLAECVAAAQQLAHAVAAHTRTGPPPGTPARCWPSGPLTGDAAFDAVIAGLHLPPADPRHGLPYSDPTEENPQP
ncbi:hypothetical protein [Cryptosporangium minutisporangium]|uniref:Uncharacterized protein n=1 Tax=Cryptosporangium minutisporangium TaxID=113569 RepID=A0ABP6T304_9ACTN